MTETAAFDPDLRQRKPVVDAPRTWLIPSFRFARRLTRVQPVRSPSDGGRSRSNFTPRRQEPRPTRRRAFNRPYADRLTASLSGCAVSGSRATVSYRIRRNRKPGPPRSAAAREEGFTLPL